MTKERELARLKRELEMLQSDPAMQAELEFKRSLEALMNEFGKTPNQILSLLSRDSNDNAQDTKNKRPLKTYKNPHTGDTIQIRSTNHKQMREWKAQYGDEITVDWLEHTDN